jgi:hypothetical protein
MAILNTRAQACGQRPPNLHRPTSATSREHIPWKTRWSKIPRMRSLNNLQVHNLDVATRAFGLRHTLLGSNLILGCLCRRTHRIDLPSTTRLRALLEWSVRFVDLGIDDHGFGIASPWLLNLESAVAVPEKRCSVDRGESPEFQRCGIFPPRVALLQTHGWDGE